VLRVCGHGGLRLKHLVAPGRDVQTFKAFRLPTMAGLGVCVMRCDADLPCKDKIQKGVDW
jgi:hypothetical protein